MSVWRILAFAVVAISSTAIAAPDDAPPKVELPLGPYVRPGRPLDVRVIGGADRVRAPGTPWALPQGERGDEFILQLTEATAGVLSLEIDRGGRVERTSMTVETLPRDAHVVGIRGDADLPAGTRAIPLPASGMPTAPEGWLVLDEVVSKESADLPGGMFVVGAAARGLFNPLLLPADRRLFDATAQAAERAPRLPRDVSALLTLLAAAELGLVVILAFRRDGPWRRAAWLVAPAAATAAFLVVGDRLPGALRAEATAIFASQYDTSLVLVRVDARRTGAATFDLPAEATSAAVLRYASDDATVESVSAGRRVEMAVPAGQTRIFAYAIRSTWPSEATADKLFLAADESSIPRPFSDWIGDAGFKRYEDGIGWYHFTADMLPRARGTTVVAGLFALAEGRAPAK